jgi:hypothetical protein
VRRDQQLVTGFALIDSTGQDIDLRFHDLKFTIEALPIVFAQHRQRSDLIAGGGLLACVTVLLQNYSRKTHKSHNIIIIGRLSSYVPTHKHHTNLRGCGYLCAMAAAHRTCNTRVHALLSGTCRLLEAAHC